jgi:GT2 family glycosyltransferase
MKAAYDGDDRTLLTPAVRHVKKGKPAAPFFFDRGISLRQDNWLVVGTLVHKDLFNEVGGFGDYPHGFEDFSLWSKCYRAGARVVKVPDAVYVYHHNPQSKHKQGWRDRKWQVETHQRVVRELDEWEASRA